MAWLALALVVAGLGYAFGVRSYLAWKATGDTGLRLDAGPVGSVGWWAKILFVLSVVLVAAGPVAVLAGPMRLTWSSPVWPQAAGTVVAVVGMLIVVAAQHGMGVSWRVGVDSREITGLVTGGLFALARNPIFTGMIVFAVGVALMVPGWISTAAVVALIWAVQMQVRLIEEPYLLASHGDAYRAYAARTGRFLPGIGRLSDPDRHRPHMHRRRP
jgi:protein-S-isoprenylcysteine O-methyltransferase Ste14